MDQNPIERVCGRFLIGVLVLLMGCSTLRGAGEPAEPPNILFVIADDWSFGHASAYGCRWVKTP